MSDIARVFDRVRPLSQRPPHRSRTRAKFKTPFSGVLTLLRREIHLAGARTGTRILEMDLDSSKIRQDGFPYANAQPMTPYVAVTFQTVSGRQFFIDGNQYWDWRDNLHAIAKSMEALRAVERWGVAQGRQYAGFLPPGSGQVINAAPIMSKEEATKALFDLAGRTGLVSTPLAELKTAALKRHHPDTGGDRKSWDRLQTVLQVLGI